MIKYNKFVITSKFVAHQHFKECHEVLKKKEMHYQTVEVVFYYSLKLKRDITLL